jgi:23S rRNA-/tRNA-specific pseudouridylate synthase
LFQVNGVLHHLGFASSKLSTLPNAAELRPGIVHRLDVGTTGVIAVAKTASWRVLGAGNGKIMGNTMGIDGDLY